MIIKLNNPNIDNNVRTYLTSQVNGSATTIYVKNTAGFANGDYIVLGKIGEDKTELVQINGAISNNTQLTVTTTKFTHGTDTSVTYIKYNQVKFYRSTDGGSTYSLLTTVSVQVDRLFTSYDDTGTSSNYYYKATFYNASGALESAYSPILPASGFSYYQLITLQDRVIDLFPDAKEEFLVRNEINDWINEEYRRMVSLASKIDKGIFLKSTESSPSSLTSGTAQYDLKSDFKAYKMVQIAYDGSNYYLAYPQHVRFGYPTMVYDKTAPLYILVGNKIEFRPTPDSSNGRYKEWYYYIPTPLTESTDSVDLALRPYLDALVYHALARSKQKDKKYDLSQTWDAETQKVETLMTDELQGRTVTDMPRWVDITDYSFIDTDDTYLFDM